MKLSGSLVFYIGNGVVKGAIVQKEHAESWASKVSGKISGKKGPTLHIPRILSARVRELPHFDERDREHLENRILTEFAELVRELKTENLKDLAHLKLSLENAFVLVSSPWYISETSIIKMDEQKPFLVTDTLINSAKENLVKGYRDSHKLDVTVLEQKIIHIMLNGYPTNEPLKKKAQTLDMTVFTSFARKSSVDRIHEIIENNFHLKKISVHSQSLVSFSVISDIWHDISQYIIADITSQLTELVAVRKGTLSEASSFPKGKQFLVKAVSDAMKVSPEVAESLIRMKNDGKIEEELEAKLDVTLKTARTDWLSSFSESLGIMSASSSLPSTFFLFAPKDVVNIFSESIAAEEYQQFSFAEGKFEVKNISVADLLPYCKIEMRAIGDLSLMIGAIFDQKLGQQLQ